MKVLIVNTSAPFVWGGAEELVLNLVKNLKARDIDAEFLRLPFRWEPSSGIPAEIARFRAMRLGKVDRVIAMKFPAYFIPCEDKTTWLIHQYRQAYDMWGSPYCNIPHDEAGFRLRSVIRRADDEHFRSAGKIFTISAEVTRRLEHYNGVESEPLRAPLNDPEIFTGGASSGYILAAGRINRAKRQLLLVDAMQYLPPSARLVIAGPPESEADELEIRERVEKLELGSRVSLDMRFLSRRELADYVNNATAVAYLPFEEDSYGYVTMEAFEAAKPVITCSDAGELLEIVRDHRTGFVTAPDPQELAGAMARLLYFKDLAREMGEHAREVWRAAGVTWEANIGKLLGQST